MKKIRLPLLSLLLLCFAAPSQAFELTVLHTNDVHSMYGGTTEKGTACYAAQCAGGSGGSVRLKQAVDTVRAAEPNVVLLDAGDEFQGTLFYTQFKGDMAAEVLDALDYTAFTPGNHEFDDGCGEFRRFAERTHVPVLAANLTLPPVPGGKPLTRPWTVVERQGRKIGIVGLVNEETPSLASPCKDAAADSVEAYDFPPLAEAMHQHPGLPKVAYMYMLQSQGLLHDTWVYGVDAKRILPTMISPTELMDGAIISGNCVSACDKNNTYVHLNNPVVKSLYEHHGKDLNFVGVIITNENVTLADKKRSSSYAVKLARMLGVDAVVISEEGFGNPDADLIMNCRKSEQTGIKTVLITDEYAGRDGSSQSLADSCPEGDACVTAGNANEIIVLPPMDKVIGDQAPAETIAGGFFGSVREDGSLEVELQAILGATNELGFNRIGGRTL